MRRRELHELLLDALEVVAAAGTRLGASELAAAERAARRLIELAPLRETGYVALMEVKAERRRPAEGLRAYEELRRLRGGALAPGRAARGASAPAAADRAAAHRLRRPRPRLARLELCLGRARTLPRQLALVAGDPGIGKTRLLSLFGALAHEAGAAVLYGRASEAGVIPYGRSSSARRAIRRSRSPSTSGCRRASAT